MVHRLDKLTSGVLIFAKGMQKKSDYKTETLRLNFINLIKTVQFKSFI